MRGLSSIAMSLVVAMLACNAAFAASPDDLDARIEALEKENAAIKKRLRLEALEKENAALKRRLNVVTLADPKPRRKPTTSTSGNGAYAMDPIVPAGLGFPPSWSGVYFGGAFGGALTRSQINSQETYTSYFPTNTSPFSMNGISTIASSSGNNNAGATLDIFAGTNVVLGSQFLAGAQLEGTISDVNFNSSGTRSLTYFNANGPTGQIASGDFRPHVHARWMLSALLRAGLLLDPATLMYALGGWTGAKFDYQNLTDNLFFEPNEVFWANGISVGGGLERKLDPNWSLRAEYRYTHFQGVNVSNTFYWTTNFPATQTNTIQTSFQNSMQVACVGISYLVPVW